MQRLAITLSAFLIIVVMIINLALFRQNTQLRSRLVAPQPTVAAASAEQAARITQLEQELKRSEDDRIKATRDATHRPVRIEVGHSISLVDAAAVDGERELIAGTENIRLRD